MPELKDTYTLRLILKNGAELVIHGERKLLSSKRATILMNRINPDIHVRWVEIEGFIATPLVLHSCIEVDAAEVVATEFYSNPKIFYQMENEDGCE